MTPDEQNNFAAILMAHEHVLTTLLSIHMKRLSPEQREQLVKAANEPPDLTGLFEEGDLDIGQADDIAGATILFRESMNRIQKKAFSIADGRSG
jgi:hypothetical protein